MNDWAALDSMFQTGEANFVPPPSYGKDAPVKATGMNPGMIGPPKAAKPKVTRKAVEDPQAIWSAAEVEEEIDPLAADDGRMEPEYQIVFKQNVCHITSHTFPCLVNPTPPFPTHFPSSPTGPSDALVLKLTLPDTKLADIDLDVRPTCVRLSAPRHKAIVQLGERVDEQKGALGRRSTEIRDARLDRNLLQRRDAMHAWIANSCCLLLAGDAKWDAEKHVLTVTLPILHDWVSKLKTSAADELD
ncbi:MAG: hypothetical protein SGPRY_003293 [Prymnesium sp.]